MDALHLHISPVYSAYHPSGQLGKGKDAIPLLQHQVETLDAFNNSEIDVIINAAMTGDGKSIAAYLPAFQHDQQVIAMYPTNELVRDQLSALKRYHNDLHLHLPPYDTMYSEQITKLMREHDTTVRLEEVRKLLNYNGMLLTNPDLIHLILSHQYGWDFMRKELAVIAGANFDYFLFDEFHVFGVLQVVSVINMLGYLHTNYGHKSNERKKYVFLSATPSQLLQDLLDKSGLRSKVIEGHYSTSEQDGKYRRILQECDITLAEISQEMPTEMWIEGHLEELLHFFKQYPESKAAILVYSPATARRLVARLKEYFEPHGIEIGENTGLIPIAERPEELKKHILVGTSTVDVGIDFHINYLIFEAFNAGSFLQRFGRLGRHDEFRTYRAYGLIPRFVLERLGMAFAGVQEIERGQFNTAVREAFPPEQDFPLYTKRWGVLQAAHVIAELENQRKKDANQAFTIALREQYERTYGKPGKPIMPRALGTYNGLKPEVSADLLHFRGQSPLECSVWDTTINHPNGHLLTYDLFFLLSNTEFEVIEEEEFMQEVRKRKIEERDFLNKLLYLKVHQYVPERLHLILGINLNLNERSDLIQHVMVISGIFASEPQVTWKDQVNARLERLKLTCIISELKRPDLKQRYKLGGTFPVYRLQDNAESEYSIVFGQEALLLESLLVWHKPKSDKAIML
jgi:CRISPR-associated endonuclease/helicase Cas3